MSHLRYYFGENADRPIRAAGKTYPFEIIGRLAGAAQGVLSVPEAEVEDFLAVAAPYGVAEITEDSYNEALVKKKQTPHSQPSVQPVTQPPEASLRGKGAVVISGSTAAKTAAAAAEAPVDLDEAVLVEKVNIADLPPTEDAANAAAPAKPRSRRGGSNT